MRVSAKRYELAPIRDFVKSHAEAAGASPVEISELIQAVDEAATNIIVHGYHETTGEIEIEIESQPGWIRIILRDHAPAFDPTLVPKPDLNLPLELRPVGGLGIHLIRHCVDEFSYKALAGGGNELVLGKHLKTVKSG